jgi:hypothetical protein
MRRRPTQATEKPDAHPAVSANWIFLIIGGLLAVLGCVVLVDYAEKTAAEVIGTAILTIAFAVLTVVVLNFLWGVMGGEPIQQSIARLRNAIDLVNDSYVSGVRRLYSHAHSFGSQDWTDQLQGASRQVDLMGYTLHSWWMGGQFPETVGFLLRAGVSVRVLVMDERNELFGKGERPDLPQKSEANLRTELRTALKSFGNLQAATSALPGNLTVKTVTQGSVKWHLCRVDHRMIAIPYMHTVLGAKCPLMVVDRAKDGIFEGLVQEFEDLWSDADEFAATRPAGT